MKKMEKRRVRKEIKKMTVQIGCANSTRKGIRKVTGRKFKTKGERIS
jgi:hypothetical protein